MNRLYLLCVPACVVISELNVGNTFVCLKAVAFRFVLSVLVAAVEDMATKARHGLLEGFKHFVQGLSFGFFNSDGIAILVSSCLPLEVFHKIIGVIRCGYLGGVVLAVFTLPIDAGIY